MALPFFIPPKGPMTLGEGPIYRSTDSTLHWVDCLSEPPELYILKVDPGTGASVGAAIEEDARAHCRIHSLADSISVMCFRRNKPGSYIAAYYQGVCFLDEESGEIEVLKEIIPTHQRSELRFNDGGVDPKGRFWLAEIDKKAAAFGVGKLPADYGRPKGRVWRYDPDGSLHCMVDGGVICGNGLAWSPDNKTSMSFVYRVYDWANAAVYLNDSVGGTVSAFDFDLESGSIDNKRLLIDYRGTDAEPDGMVIEYVCHPNTAYLSNKSSTDGNLWNAVYGTNKVMVHTPEGKLLKEIPFSGKKLTCPTWGGEENNILYITSGVDGTDTRDPGDGGGGMFMCQTDAKGLPKNEFAG